MNPPQKRQWMFIIESLSLRLCTFFFFCNIRNSAALSFSILYAQVWLSSPFITLLQRLLVADPDIYVSFICGVEEKQSKENQLSGKRQKSEERGLLMHHRHPVHCGSPANGQELIPCRGPQPRSLATITCDNRRMILSLAGRLPQRCAIAADCHNLVPSHGKSFDLKCTAVKFKKRSCQVLTRSGWVVRGFV